MAADWAKELWERAYRALRFDGNEAAAQVIEDAFEVAGWLYEEPSGERHFTHGRYEGFHDTPPELRDGWTEIPLYRRKTNG